MATWEQDVRTAFFHPRKCWLRKSVVIKGGKRSRGDSEPHTKEEIVSALQDSSLLGLAVFDMAPDTRVSSLPIKPI